MEDQFENLFGNVSAPTRIDYLIGRLKEMPINYVGNKKKLLTDIISFITDEGVKFDSFFDAFSGSGVVSLAMRSLGKKVISNDLLASSSLTALLYLECNKIPLSVEELGEIKQLCIDIGSDAPKVIRGRHDRFFTPEEAEFLDSFRAAVIASSVGSGGILVGWRPAGFILAPVIISGSEKKESLGASFAMWSMYNHILQRCFNGGRYYSGQTLARLDARQNKNPKCIDWDDLFTSLCPGNSPLNRVYNLLDGCPKGTALNGDIIYLLNETSKTTDIIYFDPPYGGASSDYSTLYKVCEDYIRGGDSCESIGLASKRFNGSNGYSEHFDNILESSKNFPAWLFSFNESSFENLDGITKRIQRFGRTVKCRPIKYVYNYRKNSRLDIENEFLILATRGI